MLRSCVFPLRPCFTTPGDSPSDSPSDLVSRPGRSLLCIQSALRRARYPPRHRAVCTRLTRSRSFCSRGLRRAERSFRSVGVAGLLGRPARGVALLWLAAAPTSMHPDLPWCVAVLFSHSLKSHHLPCMYDALHVSCRALAHLLPD